METLIHDSGFNTQEKAPGSGLPTLLESLCESPNKKIVYIVYSGDVKFSLAECQEEIPKTHRSELDRMNKLYKTPNHHYFLL